MEYIGFISFISIATNKYGWSSSFTLNVSTSLEFKNNVPKAPSYIPGIEFSLVGILTPFLLASNASFSVITFPQIERKSLPYNNLKSFSK